MESTEESSLPILENAIQEALIGFKITQSETNFMLYPNTTPTLPYKTESGSKLQYKQIEPRKEIREESKFVSQKNEITSTKGQRERCTNTTSFPQSAHGIVIVRESEKDTKAKWGSGVLIGADVVLTSAYNVYQDEKPLRKRYPYISFIPGANENEAPFGEIEVQDVYVPNDYINHIGEENGLNPNGYAVLILKKQIGRETGYFGVHAESDEKILRKKRVFVAGYPENSTKEKESDQRFELWKATAKITEVREGLIHYTKTETSADGEAGSGLFYQDNNFNVFVVGVHIGSTENSNIAWWITKEIFLELHEWIKLVKAKKLEKIVQNQLDEDLRYVELRNQPYFREKIDINQLLEYKLVGLEEVNLESNGVDENTIEMICGKSQWSKLKSLNLDYNQLGDGGCEKLCIHGDEDIDKDDDSVEEKVKPIKRDIVWKGLEVLSLASNSIGAKGAKALGRSTAWRNLRKLDISLNGSLGDAGGAAILKNTAWSKLETLTAFWATLGNESVTSLVNNASFKNLRNLDLANNDIDADAGVLLGKNGEWSNLEYLCLSRNQLGTKGAVAIAANTKWVNLKKLDLSSNGIDEEGGVAIGKNVIWTKLEELTLYGNEIGDLTAISIASNTAWCNLKHLVLSDGKISDEGAVAIGKNVTWTKLDWLWLERNNIGATGAAAIANNKAWSNLRVLSLGHNNIGSEGAAALGGNTTWTNLQELWLMYNSIGDAGAIGLAKNSVWENLGFLDLSTNDIGDEGAIAIAQNTAWSQLNLLMIYANKIGWRGGLEIARNQNWKCMEDVNAAGNIGLDEEKANALKTIAQANANGANYNFF